MTPIFATSKRLLPGGIAAVLSILAAVVLIAALTAGGVARGASETTTSGGDLGSPATTPSPQSTPERCITPAQPVVSIGRYAIFDVYWDEDHEDGNDHVDTLVANPCPAQLTVTTDGNGGNNGNNGNGGNNGNNGNGGNNGNNGNGGNNGNNGNGGNNGNNGNGGNNGNNGNGGNNGNNGNGGNNGNNGNGGNNGNNGGSGSGSSTATYSTQRAGSRVNLDSTVIHVSESYKKTLDGTVGSDDRTNYAFLHQDWDSDGNNEFPAEYWELPYCKPGYSSDQSGLCIAFSAALLNPDDWGPKPDDPDGDVSMQYEFESIREPGIEAEDRGSVFVYYPHAETPDGVSQETWSSDSTNESALPVKPGEYEYRHWGFTKPGTYRLQVHFKAHPSATLQAHVGNSELDTVTSVVRHYTFHVGLLADQSVSLTADKAVLSPGDTVTYTVTAKNAGPNKAENAQVLVELPKGLTFGTAATPTGTAFADATAPDWWTLPEGAILKSWNLGDLAAPGQGGSAVTQTMTFTATVDEGTRGHKLETKARIFATETIGGSTVRELDPDTSDNAASVTVTPGAVTNHTPFFYVERSIAENSAPGTNVGAIIPVNEADSSDTLTYSLTGAGSTLFSAVSAAGGAQIQVAPGVSVNYEDAPRYDLVLGVSDGLDSYGNADASVDGSIGLRVNVTDVAEETLAVTFSANPASQTAGQWITLTAYVTNSPVATSQLGYNYSEYDENGNHISTASSDGPSALVYSGAAATRQYDMSVYYADSFGSQVETTSEKVTVTWTAP